MAAPSSSNIFWEKSRGRGYRPGNLLIKSLGVYYLGQDKTGRILSLGIRTLLR
jgi:hypothetical protein